MAKQFQTTVSLRDNNHEAVFRDPIAYQQAHAHQDIHSMESTNGVEMFIPWRAVGHILCSVGEVASDHVIDAFCGETAENSDDVGGGGDHGNA